MFATVLHDPRKLWLRRVLFQIHLWVGILLALYAIVISLSGSILVFQDEIRRATLRQAPLDKTHLVSVGTLLTHAQKRFPAARLTYLGFPQMNTPWWTIYLTDAHGKPDLIYAEAASGDPITTHGRLFIDFVLDLHVYLLAGRTGFIVNCIAGMGLLLLAVTGALLWWPGVTRVKQALTVSLRSGWKRVNYDLHNSIGIWTLGIVSWWGITAIYFLFPAQVGSVVNAISPLVGMKPPSSAPSAPASGAKTFSLDEIIVRVPAISPGSLSGVGLPETAGAEVTVYVDRRAPGDFSHRDILTFDGHTGKLLSSWHYGQNHSVGDWFLWLMYPLHFGTLWGIGVKILWSLLGLSVSVLSVTGLLMYWNRKLGKWWAESKLQRRT